MIFHMPSKCHLQVGVVVAGLGPPDGALAAWVRAVEWRGHRRCQDLIDLAFIAHNSSLYLSPSTDPSRPARTGESYEFFVKG